MDATEFSRYVEHINEAGYTALLLSIGHQLGLFQLMQSQNRPMTSQEIADIAGMKERYVREWLSGVAAGKFVTYDQEAKTFYIPEHYHDSLKAQPAFSVGVSVFGGRTEALKQCFMEEGPYGYPGGEDSFWWFFSDLRSVSSKEYTEKCLVANLRQTPAFGKLESGISVLDACCGSGEFTLEFAAMFPKSTFTGLDLFERPLAIAKQNASSSKLENISIIKGDILNLPEQMTEKYEMVLLFDTLHDLPDPYKALSEVHKALKSGGIIVVLEIRAHSHLEDNVGTLRSSMLYTWSLYNCLPSSLSGDARVGYGTCWGRQNAEEAIARYFTIEGIYDVSHFHVQFVGIKK